MTDPTSTATSARATVVLVHGAFADASGFGGVIRELQSAGATVRAPANPLRGLAFDSEYVAAFVAAIEGPVLLVGHSYGGAVITQASAGLPNVVGLVYLAAFGLDVGETCGGVGQPFPPPLLNTNSRPTAYEAGAGAAPGPDLYIDYELFRETFCADAPVDDAAVMAATQRPVATAVFGEACTAAGWKDRPSWFLVSEQDQAIAPEAEHFMADRMGATKQTIKGSHVAFHTHPVEVAAFISSALDTVTG